MRVRVASAVTIAIAAAAVLVRQQESRGGPPPVVANCRLHGPIEHRPRCLPSRDLVLRAHGRTLRAQWAGRLSSDLFAGWTQRQFLPGRLRAVRVGGSRGRHVGRFVVRPGDTPVPGGERAEVAASPAATGGVEGAEAWYAWSTYFPAGLHPLPDHTWNVFTQFHQTGRDHCSPNIALQLNTRLRPARIRLAVRGGWLSTRTCRPQMATSFDGEPLRLRRWYDFALHVRWSSNPRLGFVELLVNGRRSVPRTPLATLYRGQAVYVKQGFYRGPSPQVSQIVHSGMTRFG